MKANHNYYVNSAESLADAIKAIFFPPPRRKTYGPVALAAPHLNRAKNQLVLLQPKQNRWHCSHLLSAHRVCALTGDHCHHGQRHLVLPPDLPPEWFKNPQPGGWASCWLSLAGAGCQGREVAPTPASLHSCATPVPPDHQHPTDRCCCSHTTMKGRPQKQSIFLLQSSMGIIIKKKKQPPHTSWSKGKPCPAPGTHMYLARELFSTRPLIVMVPLIIQMPSPPMGTGQGNEGYVHKVVFPPHRYHANPLPITGKLLSNSTHWSWAKPSSFIPHEAKLPLKQTNKQAPLRNGSW